MKDKYEIEYSFICTVPETIDKLRQEYVCDKFYYLHDLYFDTDDRILSKNKFVYRQRYQEGKSIYTLKGPTSGTPPKRLELESTDSGIIYRELKNRLPEVSDLYHKLDVIQERHTRREEFQFIPRGFTMYIDTTKFDNILNGARYVNIEVEGIIIKELNDVRNDLLRLDGIREWKPSKFQVGEAVKALEMTGDLSTEDLHKIEIYLGNKEKRGKQI